MGRVYPVCEGSHDSEATCPAYAKKGSPAPAADAKPEKTADAESLVVEIEAASAAQPGTMLGAYRLLEVIGSGGMGQVFRARDTALDRDVAVKLISREFLSGHGQAVERFLAEARLTAKIRHPSIVQVYALGTDSEGTPYLVMELLQGRTLGDALKAKEEFPLPRIVQIGSQILSALATAHEHVVHRDLKPGNVFLSRDADGGDHVTLLDFGVAKAVNDAVADLTGKQKLVLGTRRYSAPEMLLGTGPRDDPRQDLYAVGVLLFLMASRKFPWTPAEFDVLENLLCAGRKPRSLKEVAPEVDPFFAEVVDRALVVDPAERWASATAFRAALRSLGLFAPGALVADTYRIERQVGGGGSSAVYLARDVRMERACALKALLVSDDDDPSGTVRERFRRDGALAKEVRHPNVVEVFAQGVFRGRPYLVTEFVEGRTLREWARSADWPRFLGVIRQIAAAIDAVHEKGIVHRDVTPENILVRQDRVAKLVDFGIARRSASELTGSSVGFMLGRFGYTAPEQAAEPREATAFSDEWSLAAIVYEALTGLTPFRDLDDENEASPVESYMSRLLNAAAPANPGKTNATVGPALAAVLTRALSRDVTQRFPSALAFVEAISAAPSAGVRLMASFGATAEAAALADEPSPITAMAWSTEARPREPRIPRWVPRLFLATAIALVGTIFLTRSGGPFGTGKTAKPEAARAPALTMPDAGQIVLFPEPAADFPLEVHGAGAAADAGTTPKGVAAPPADDPSLHPAPSPPKRGSTPKHHAPAPKKPDPATDKEGTLKI